MKYEPGAGTVSKPLEGQVVPEGERLRIAEIFTSIQGEGYFTGCLATFIRLAGCNLQCPFCDTPSKQGELVSSKVLRSELVKRRAEEGKPKHLVLTGGEPTLQPILSLIENLGPEWTVQIETNGTLPDELEKLREHAWITWSPKPIKGWKERYQKILDDLAAYVNEVKLLPCLAPELIELIVQSSVTVDQMMHGYGIPLYVQPIDWPGQGIDWASAFVLLEKYPDKLRLGAQVQKFAQLR